MGALFIFGGIMRPITIVLTIIDSKGHENQMLINLVNQSIESDLSNLETIATNHQIDIDALTEGQIVRCGLVIDVELDSSLKIAPVSNASNEAGAIFVFTTDGGFSTQIRIPAFMESKIVSGTPEVDLTDSAVQDLIDHIVDGYSNGSVLRDIVDSRGDDIVMLGSAKEVFQRGRV